MAAKLQRRVEDYVGTFSDVDALDGWFTQGAARLIDMAPEAVLGPYAGTYGFTYNSTGPAVGSYRIWSVHVDGRPATFVTASKWPKVGDPGSMYRATKDFPAWTWLNGRMSVYPHATTSFVATPKSLVTCEDTTIEHVPEELVQTVVLYAALNAQLHKLNDALTTGITDLHFAELGDVPQPPPAPAFTHTPAASGVTLPSSISVTLGTAPTFTPPTHAIDFTTAASTLDTEEDIELAGGKVNEILARIRDYEAELQTKVQDFQADLAVYQNQLNVFIKNAELTTQLLLESSRQSADLSIRNNDAETARQVAEYAAMLNRYSSQVQAYAGVAAAEAQRFDAEVKRVAMDIQGAQTKLMEIRVLYAESLSALGLAAPEPARRQEKAQ